MIRKIGTILILFLLFISPLVAGEDLAEKTFSINVSVSEHAVLDVKAAQLFKEPLLGEEGLYISNGNQVREYSKGLWDTDYVVNHDSVSGVLFDIQANADVNVDVDSDFAGWLNSPTGFLVFEHWSPYNYLGVISNDDVVGGENLTFIHTAGEISQYKIGGVVNIQNIYDQVSGNYSTDITITVSKVDE